MPTIEVTDATFEARVMRADGPVLVDFWAPWCEPCKAVAPVLEALSDELAGLLTIAKVNTDENPGVSQALRIQSIPTIVLFENGRPTQAVQGALPKDKLIAQLKEWLPALSGPGITVEELQALLKSGAPVTLFDVREEQHFGRSHLLTSTCVAADDLPETIASVTPGTAIVLICRTGEVSAEEAKKLSASGIRVQSLEKGLLEWEGDGLPTYSNREEEKLREEGKLG